MRWKTTVVLLAVTLGVGAYVSLYEIRQPAPDEREGRAKQILALDPEAVTQVVIDLPQAKATLTRAGSAWRLAPNNLRADPSVVSGLLGQISPLTAERILWSPTGKPLPAAQRPLDLKAFGLDPSLGWLTLVANGTPTTLLFGETTAVGHSRYLKVSNRPEVFVVTSDLFEAANQPLERFRDHTLVRVNAWQADQVTLAFGASTLALVRHDDEWQVRQPVVDRADRSAVNALLNQVGNIAIKRFVEETPQVEQRATWGLDQPAAELTLVQRGETIPTVTLFVGKPLPDDASLVYAKRSDEPALYAVAHADVESLRKDPSAVRSKTCLDVSAGEVIKIEVAHGAARWTAARSAPPANASSWSEPNWKVVETGDTLEGPRVEEVVRTLAQLQLERFVEEAPTDLARYGLEPPAGSVSVWMQDRAAPQRVTVGAPIEGSQSRYGRLEGRTAVVALPPAVMDLVATTPDTLKPPVAEVTPAPHTPRVSQPARTHP